MLDSDKIRLCGYVVLVVTVTTGPDCHHIIVRTTGMKYEN